MCWYIKWLKENRTVLLKKEKKWESTLIKVYVERKCKDSIYIYFVKGE